MKRLILFALCLLTVVLGSSTLVVSSTEGTTSHQLADGNKPGTGGG
jgi:hypothetical protein